MLIFFFQLLLFDELEFDRWTGHCLASAIWWVNSSWFTLTCDYGVLYFHRWHLWISSTTPIGSFLNFPCFHFNVLLLCCGVVSCTTAVMRRVRSYYWIRRIHAYIGHDLMYWHTISVQCLVVCQHSFGASFDGSSNSIQIRIYCTRTTYGKFTMDYLSPIRYRCLWTLTATGLAAHTFKCTFSV